MLAQARRRYSNWPGVRFIHDDFRSFHLDQPFDAVVCAGNSLNYVADNRELSAVLASVARHLKANGLFVFDTYTHEGMQYLSGQYLHADVDGRRFAISFHYDPRQRREKSLLLMPMGIETHRRIPIDPKDVLAAARGSGLEVEDYFSRPIIPGWWFTGLYCVFVLRKRGSSVPHHP